MKCDKCGSAMNISAADMRIINKADLSAIIEATVTYVCVEHEFSTFKVRKMYKAVQFEE